MNIYIVRHGQTEENLKGTYYGVLNCSITDLGINQAKALGQKLENIKFDKVYCSSLNRAKETLAYIYKGNEIIVDSRLNERNFGIFEGKTYAELEEDRAEEYKAWTDDWKDYRPKDGESFRDSYLRAYSFMEDLKSQSEENILICTHGGIVKAIYTYILEGNLDIYWRFNSRNGDLSIIKNQNGYFYIDSIIPTEF